jgi:hypothetical protein
MAARLLVLGIFIGRIRVLACEPTGKQYFALGGNADVEVTAEHAGASSGDSCTWILVCSFERRVRGGDTMRRKLL